MSHRAHIKRNATAAGLSCCAVRCLVLLALAILPIVAASCSGNQPSTFRLTSASADPAYRCPANANNVPYDVHATVGVRNGTASVVTIKGVKAEMTLKDVSGDWLEKVGDAYDAGAASFTPGRVKPGSTATLQVKFASACTSPAYGSGPTSYGDYRITLRVTTSAGTYTISTTNLHRIVAA